MLVRDVLVVGAGPAGLATAIAASKRGLTCQVIEKGSAGQFAAALSDRDGVLHDARADGDRRHAVRQPVRQADAAWKRFATIAGSRTRTSWTWSSTRPSSRSHRSLARASRRLRAGLSSSTPNPRAASGDRGTRARSCLRPAPTTCRIGSTSRAKISRTSRTTTASRIRSSAKRSSSSAARTPRRRQRSTSFGRRVARRSCTGARRSGRAIKYWVKPDIENRIKEGSIQPYFEHARRGDPSDDRGRRDEGETRGDRGGRGVSADRLRRRYDAAAQRGRRYRPARRAARSSIAETFETNVPGVYTVGAMVAGVQSGKIFIENGRFHGEKVIEGIQKKLVG